MVFIVKLVIPVSKDENKIIDIFNIKNNSPKSHPNAASLMDSSLERKAKKVTIDSTKGSTIPNTGNSNFVMEELNMEEAVARILQEMEITNDVWCPTHDKKSFMIEFYVVNSDQLDTVLNKLAYFNVGKVQNSLIVVTEATASIVPSQKMSTLNPNDASSMGGENPVSSFQKFLNSLKSRLTVAQVYNAISNRGDFTVDYLAFIICAAVLADVALVTNRPPVLFASMLLSPMMDPILCVLFGLRLREENLIKKGVKNTLFSIAICFIVGILLGVVTHAIANFEMVTPYPTPEITSRGNLNYLPNTAIVTVFSGVSTAFAILNNAVSAMIGNAISLSILPPAVNSGHLVFLSMLSSAQKLTKTSSNISSSEPTQQYCNYNWIRQYEMIYMSHTCSYPEEFAIQAAISMMVTILNIVCILIIGYLVCIAKDFAPAALTNQETKKFYKEDIKEVQETIKTIKYSDLNARKLAQTAFEEYKRCMGIDPDNDAENNLAAEDFSAVVAAVEKDHHYLTIRGKCPEQSNLMSRVKEVTTNETITTSNPSIKRQYSMLSRLRQTSVGNDEISPLRNDHHLLLDSESELTVRMMRRPRSMDVSNYERLKMIQGVTHKMTSHPQKSPNKSEGSTKHRWNKGKAPANKFEVTSATNV